MCTKFNIQKINIMYVFLSCVCFQMWYQFGKTTAENIARKFLTENNIELIVINPALSIGPLLQPELNGSASLILDLINGNFIINFFSQAFYYSS